ncbi:MAG: hypothetical protein HC923_06145 [Myxococcales bacterium]|nr:hypothetical protein [Myxococcales bacterium]
MDPVTPAWAAGAPMTYADELLEGLVTAIELDVWELAEAMARVLARHIAETGEYPQAMPAAEVDVMVRQYRAAEAFGAS